MALVRAIEILKRPAKSASMNPSVVDVAAVPPDWMDRGRRRASAASYRHPTFLVLPPQPKPPPRAICLKPNPDGWLPRRYIPTYRIRVYLMMSGAVLPNDNGTDDYDRDR